MKPRLTVVKSPPPTDRKKEAAQHRAAQHAELVERFQREAAAIVFRNGGPLETACRLERTSD
jgi:hypothetical protein